MSKSKKEISSKDNPKISVEFNERVIQQYITIKKQDQLRKKGRYSPKLIDTVGLFVTTFLFILSISFMLVNEMLFFALGVAASALVLLGYFMLSEYFLKKNSRDELSN